MARIALAANDGWGVVNFRSGLIRDLRRRGHEVVVLAPDGRHTPRIEALGARFHPLALNPRGQSVLGDLAVLVRYRRALAKLRPDVFLGFTAKPNAWGSIAAHSLGIPVINNVTGAGTVFIQGGRLERIVSALYRIAFRRSATVFFQNEDDRDLFLGRGLVRPEQLRLLPGSGIDLERFVLAPPPPADSPFTFLLPARLIWDKGVGEYAEAARILRGRGHGARFRLIGKLEPPTPQSIPESRIREWVSEGLIDYRGAVDDVRDEFAAAHCIVLPSYREGTPRSLLEAGALGRPAVTTDVPGCRAVVVEGETGLLCKPRSAEALAEAMAAMAALPPERRAAMGTAARARIERIYDERRVHQAYADALWSLGIGRTQ